MNKKLFAFDMDGTILNDDNKVQKETIEAIKKGKEKGHIFIIATGRPFEDAIKDLQDVLKYIDYIVANNGAYYCKPDGSNVIFEALVSHEIMEKVIEVGTKHNCFFAVHASLKALRTYLGDECKKYDCLSPKELAYHKKEFEPKSVKLNYILDWIKDKKIAQISLKSNKETILKARDELKHLSDLVDTSIANDIYLDVNGKNVSKLNGIKKVADHFNIKLEDIIAFGDSGNDIKMLEGVGLGICMDNGTKEAKQAAKKTIGNNNSDTIGKTILELINE